MSPCSCYCHITLLTDLVISVLNMSQRSAIVFFTPAWHTLHTLLHSIQPIEGQWRGAEDGERGWEHSTGAFVSTAQSSAAVETVRGRTLCHRVTDCNSQPLCLLSTINVAGFVLVAWLQGITEQICLHSGEIYSERGQFKTHSNRCAAI